MVRGEEPFLESLRGLRPTHHGVTCNSDGSLDSCEVARVGVQLVDHLVVDGTCVTELRIDVLIVELVLNRSLHRRAPIGEHHGTLHRATMYREKRSCPVEQSDAIISLCLVVD